MSHAELSQRITTLKQNQTLYQSKNGTRLEPLAQKINSLELTLNHPLTPLTFPLRRNYNIPRTHAPDFLILYTYHDEIANLPDEQRHISQEQTTDLIHELLKDHVNLNIRGDKEQINPVSYTHLTLPTNREV